jgi:hypothetical protein
MNDLHGKIMNIQADHTASTADYKSKREAYIFGHRDARHAAAELALAALTSAPAEPSDELILRTAYQHLRTWDQDTLRFARAVLAIRAPATQSNVEDGVAGAILREVIALAELRSEMDHALQADAESRDWAAQQKANYQLRLDAVVRNARAALKAVQPVK